MRDALNDLASRIASEIGQTGALEVGGIVSRGSAPHSADPFKGQCANAVEKLKELAPDLDIRVLSLKIAAENALEQGFHIVAEVHTPEGAYLVDPTIWQYLPGAPLVYGPEELYPLKLVSLKLL